MKFVVALFMVVLFASCASQAQRPVGARDGRDVDAQKLAIEAHRYDAADVRAEVERRVRACDLRFKGWQKGIADTVVTLPGISKEEGKQLEQLKLPDAEVLYIEEVFPIVADMRAYEKKTAAMFSYMQRFNRALFDKLTAEKKIPNQPNKRTTDKPASPLRV